MFNQYEPLPFLHQLDPKNGTMTPNHLLDGDLNSCLQFSRYQHPLHLQVRILNVKSSNLTILGQGLNCQDIIAGMRIATDDEICWSVIVLCTLETIHDGTLCHYQCNAEKGVRVAAFVFDAIRGTEVCEVDTQESNSFPTIIPPFNIDLYWDEYLEFLKGK